jgi:hypothetical protein
VINLDTTGDYATMILIAAALGLVGGLAAELLLKRGDDTGTIEKWHTVKGADAIDIGFLASLILGAVAAVAVLYFFPPDEKTTTVAANGTTTTVHQFDLVKLVALSLIVGSAGPAFLVAAQSKVLSALNAQKANAAVDSGKAQADQMVASATAAAPTAVQAAVLAHIPGTDAATLQAITDAATGSLDAALKPQLAVAHQQMDASVGGAAPDDVAH